MSPNTGRELIGQLLRLASQDFFILFGNGFRNGFGAGSGSRRHTGFGKIETKGSPISQSIRINVFFFFIVAVLVVVVAVVVVVTIILKVVVINPILQCRR